MLQATATERLSLGRGDIQIENVGKCYRMYQHPLDRLREAVSLRGRRWHQAFWALRGLTLSIRGGETWGIVGRNGSGKSTLLQMLCGTVRPTEGAIRSEGRIAALLELGAGFNPEFTGEENMAINASLLGLSSHQIAQRHDAIVAFADLGAFIDQPVKTYSSGMFVRLAFAIACHADPDILIVDEALSVGDIAFQNKCMSRIHDLRCQGMTLIVVSHDLSRLQLLCDQAAWLHQGRLKAVGDPIEICQNYAAFLAGSDSGPSPASSPVVIPQQQTGAARFLEIRLDPVGPEPGPRALKVGETLSVSFVLEALTNLDEIVFAISVYGADGMWLVGQTSRDAALSWPPLPAGQSCQGCVLLSPLALAPGDYRLCMGAYSSDLTLLYALSELTFAFSVRSDHPSWGRFHHPCLWVRDPDNADVPPMQP